jgi:thiamine-phosphate pyrophosphorylase
VDGVSELEALSRTAATFPPRTVRGIVLPSLLFFTDPARVPNPEAVAERLPRGAGIMFRAYGAADAIEQGRRLRQIANTRGLLLFAGAEPDLADAIQADGLHMPERMVSHIPTLKEAYPHWLVTTAAHGRAAIAGAEQAGADAVVISPVFPSNSPSAGAPLGIEGLQALVGATALPVYALGGVRKQTAAQLIGSGIIGIAAVEALAG